MWRSVGFLMSFAVVMEGMTLIAFLVVIVGGKQKRESGWKILSGLLVLAALIQCIAMALVVGSPVFSNFTFHISSQTAMVDEGQELGPRLTNSDYQVYLYHNDDRFFPGWKLDTSWILCTVSWSLTVLLSGFITSTALLLPQEGGYELIADHEPRVNRRE